MNMREAYAVIAAACRAARQGGLIAGFNGNLSLRLAAGGEDWCVITRSGAAKGFLRPTDLIRVRFGDVPVPEADDFEEEGGIGDSAVSGLLEDEGDMGLPEPDFVAEPGEEGAWESGAPAVANPAEDDWNMEQHAPGPGRNPSSELSMHLALYRARPDATAVAHVHPPRLTALSLRVRPEDFLRLPLYEAETMRSRLAFMPALPPGSDELALAAAAAARSADALWMERHGLTCLGTDMYAALALAEELEHLARVQLALLGGRSA